MKKVKIIGRTCLRRHQLDALREQCDLEVFPDNVPLHSVDEVIRRIGDAEIAVVNTFTPLPEEVAERCSQLKHVVSGSAGIDHVDLDAFRSRGIEVVWFPSYCIRTMAEKTFAFILMAMNEIPSALRSVQNGRWDYLSFLGHELEGKTLGILGLGATGALLKRFAEAFEMKVLGVTSKSSHAEVEDLLRASDVVSLHMPLTQATRHFLNRERLSLMKDHVAIINVARGKLIDEAALLEFLEAHPKARAFLDVLEEEPPSVDHPFRNRPNITITPHIAWGSHEAVERLGNQMYEGLKRLLMAE